MNVFAHFLALYTIKPVLSRVKNDDSARFLQDFTKKLHKGGLTNRNGWCIMTSVKGKGVFELKGFKGAFSLFNTIS